MTPYSKPRRFSVGLFPNALVRMPSFFTVAISDEIVQRSRIPVQAFSVRSGSEVEDRPLDPHIAGTVLNLLNLNVLADQKRRVQRHELFVSGKALFERLHRLCEALRSISFLKGRRLPNLKNPGLADLKHFKEGFAGGAVVAVCDC